MPYFFEPGDVLVCKTNNTVVGEVASHWSINKYLEDSEKCPSANRRVRPTGKLISPSVPDYWEIKFWYYEYDGFFYKKILTRKPVNRFEEPGEVVPMTSLKVYPLRFADGGVEELLAARGRTFWSCRSKRLVEYPD